MPRTIKRLLLGLLGTLLAFVLFVGGGIFFTLGAGSDGFTQERLVAGDVVDAEVLCKEDGILALAEASQRDMSTFNNTLSAMTASGRCIEGAYEVTTASKHSEVTTFDGRLFVIWEVVSDTGFKVYAWEAIEPISQPSSEEEGPIDYSKGGRDA